MSDWVRLWRDMPTDPKWRVISKRSGQPLTCVIALFTMLMTEAGGSDDRGSISGLTVEDAAAALDMDEEAVAAIVAAMQGRVIEEGRLTGWERIRAPGTQDGRLPATEWSALRASIFSRDDFTCSYCGARGGKLECDHIVPLSRGGANCPSNLTTACAPCNRVKHARTPQEMGWWK